MTTYEYYQHEKEYCEQMAVLNINDPALYKFFKNAAAGFEMRISKLTLAEAGA